MTGLPTTTFEKLNAAGACAERYKHLARELGGIKKYGRDTPITLLQILDSNGMGDLFWALANAVETTPDLDRILRLFACDCAERALRLERDAGRELDPRSWAAVAVSRQFAVGEATAGELAAAGNAARDVAWNAAGYAAGNVARNVARNVAWNAAGYAAWNAAGSAVRNVAGNAARDVAWAVAWDAERAWQTERLRSAINPKAGEEKGGDDEETEEDAIIIDEEHVVSIEEEQDWYFTFGSGQVHDGRLMQGCYTIFRGTFRSARAKMCERYGLVWSFQYSSEEEAGVLRHGLTRV